MSDINVPCINNISDESGRTPGHVGGEDGAGLLSPTDHHALRLVAI